MAEKLQELEESTTKLLALLKGREEGLLSWRSFMGHRLAQQKKLIDDLLRRGADA